VIVGPSRDAHVVGEEPSFAENGNIAFSWPKEAAGFDFLIATVTKPNLTNVGGFQRPLAPGPSRLERSGSMRVPLPTRLRADASQGLIVRVRQNFGDRQHATRERWSSRRAATSLVLVPDCHRARTDQSHPSGSVGGWTERE